MTTRKLTSHSYYVCMIDYGRRGLEGFCQPERTRQNIVDMIRSGELSDIVFIHHVDGLFIEDCTDELIEEAQSGFRTFARPDEIDRQAVAFDHARDLRKNYQAAE